MSFFPALEPNDPNVVDSTAATLTHIRKVNANIIDFCTIMLQRAKTHDESKLHEPEKSVFDSYSHLLYSTPYMSEQYKSFLELMKPALEHHENQNSHHPGYYKNGVNGMDLFDLIEMFCDWRAACERTKDGNFLKSLLMNKDRFKIDPQLHRIFLNTWFNVSTPAQVHEQCVAAGVSKYDVYPFESY